MEQKRRTWAKAITWQLLGLVVMTLVNYLYLGDWRQGASLSASLTFISLLSYVMHERLWGLIRWGLASPSVERPRPRP